MSAVSRPILRYTAADHPPQPAEDSLAVEEPLEIRLAEEPLAVTMRTPGHDLELAAGFCLTEGIVAHADEIERVEPCAQARHGNVVAVHLSEEALSRRREQVARARREFYLSSSCGLCGKQSIERIAQQLPPLAGRFTVSPEVLGRLPDLMRQAQATFAQTGGLHAAAFFTPEGVLRVLREDVGRHNAVDKVLGWALLQNRLPLDPGVLLVSGRASFEILQKAAMAGVAFVGAVSAPSSLAADFARQTDITLIGFLRQGRMNVYSGDERIARPR